MTYIYYYMTCLCDSFLFKNKFSSKSYLIIEYEIHEITNHK